MLTETPMEMAILMATLADQNETIRATVTERAVVMLRRWPPVDRRWVARAEAKSPLPPRSLPLTTAPEPQCSAEWGTPSRKAG